MDTDRRNRDEDGRPRNARPRDALGRPLPWGAEGVPRIAEGVVREPAETIAEAQRLLDAGMPFHAHEILEDAWKSAPEAERPLWQGITQLAVGLTHLRRGNPKGAHTLFVRGANRIRPFAAQAPHGLDVEGLLAWAEDALVSDAADVEAPRLARREAH